MRPLGGIGAAGGAILTSLDGGATYTATNGYAPSSNSGDYPQAFRASPDTDNLAMQDTSTSHIYVSKNGGTKWSPVDLPTHYVSQSYFYLSATSKNVFVSDFSGALLSASFGGL